MRSGHLPRRIAVAVLAAVVIVVAVVPAAALVALQNSGVAHWAASKLLGLANPFAGRVITVGSVEGDWWSGLTLTGVRLVPAGRSPSIAMDTVRARYASLIHLVRAHELESLEVAGVTVTATQERNGTWDLLAPFAKPKVPAPPPNGASPSSFAIGRLALRRASLTAILLPDTAAGRRHGPVVLNALDVAARDVRLGTTLALRLDTLHARLEPARPGLPALTVDASGALAQGRLELTQFAARGGGTFVTAHGSLALADSAHPQIHDVDLVLDAQPVRFADLSLLVAGLAPHDSATLHVEAKGSTDTVRLAATGRFGRGGHVLIGGVVTTGATDVLDSLDIRLENVELKSILAAATETGSVTGTLALRVHGASLRTADGTARLDLAPSVRYGTYTARNVTARATMTRGLIRATVNGTLRPWRVAATATLAPFDSTRARDIVAHVATVGSHPAALDSADVHATLHAQRIAFAGRAEMAGGTATATGDATLGAPLAWRVTNGTLTHVNLSRVMGDAATGAFTGRFSATGRGTSFATAVAQARIHLAPSIYGAIRVRQADVALALRGGTATLGASAALDTGTVDLAASIRPGGAHPELLVRRASFAHLDAGRLGGDTALSTDLTGALAGRATWRAGAARRTLRGEARLTLGPSRAGTQHIDSVLVTASIRNGDAAWHADAAAPHGVLALGGSARPFDARPSFTIDTGIVRGLDLAALTGRAELPTNLDGTVTARVAGLDPDSAHWTATLALAPSTVRGIAIDSVKVGVKLDSGVLHVAAGVAAPDGRGNGTIDGRLVAAGTKGGMSLDRILAEADLRVRAHAWWTLAEAAPDTAIMLANADTVTLPPDTAVAALRLTGGRLAIDTLDVHSVLGTLTGTGSAVVSPAHAHGAAPPDLQLVLATRDLTPVAQVLGINVLGADSARVALSVTGAADTPQVRVVARARGVVYNSNRVDALDADLTAAAPGLRRLAGTQGIVRATDADLAGMAARTLDVTLGYADSLARVSVATTLDDGTTAGLVAAAVPDSIQSALRLDSLEINHDKYHWRLAHPVPVSYGTHYAIKDFVLASNTGRRIAIDGSVGRTGTERLTVQVDSVSLAPFARALGYHALAGAKLVGQATLGGTAAAPRLHAEAVVVLPKAHADSGTVHAVVDWTSARLDLDGAVTPVDGHSLTVKGYVPVRLSLAEGDALISVLEHGAVDLRIASSNLDLQTIEPFLSGQVVDQTRGALTMEARVGGTADAPQLSGRMSVHGLLLRLPAMGVTYDRGTIIAHLADDRLAIDTATMRSGDGTARLTGGLVLRRITLGEFDLHASMHKFRAVWSTAYQVAASGDVAFKGTTKAPALSGALTIDNGTLDLSATGSGGSTQPVTLTEAELRSIAARFGEEAVEPGGTQATTFFDKLALDLKVTTDRDAWVRRRANPQLQVELSGTVEARKDPRGPLRLYGTLEPVEGRSFVAQFGRRFTVNEGTLTFNGPPQRMRMDIKTQYVVPSTGDPNAAEVTINLDVSGTPDRIRLVLGSDPQMSNSDIISYIATGHPEGAGLGLGIGSSGSSSLAMQAGTSVAVNQLQGIVQGIGQDKLQLDVIEIRQDAVHGATLVAGRYVSSRVYVGFAQPLGFGQTTTDLTNQNSYPEAQVEYNAFKWLLMRLEGGVSDMRFLLRSRYSY
ncbi:MAG TPA: translocation/assembly module TamB domain-containing protein [Gemmatimonadaceae bacterium]|nr:translocation/assembly module TamB domain-containing protein [Gemmatimonadaceae bacterium]